MALADCFSLLHSPHRLCALHVCTLPTCDKLNRYGPVHFVTCACITRLWLLLQCRLCSCVTMLQGPEPLPLQRSIDRHIRLALSCSSEGLVDVARSTLLLLCRRGSMAAWSFMYFSCIKSGLHATSVECTTYSMFAGWSCAEWVGATYVGTESCRACHSNLAVYLLNV